MLRSRAALLLPLVCCVVLLPSIALGQAVAPPVIATGAVSAATIVIAAFGVLGGYVSQAINSGSLFGVVTLPKQVLPYLGLLGGFLGAFTTSITQAPLHDEAAWLTALFAGLVGLGGVVAGVTAKQHLDAHLRDRTPAGGGSAGGNRQLADALRRAVNDAKAVSSADDTVPPPTAARSEGSLPVLTSARQALTRYIEIEQARLDMHEEAERRRITREMPRRWFLSGIPSFVICLIGTALTCVVAASCAGGVPTPQTQAEIAASEALGVCVEETYVSEASQTPPPAALQIALAIAGACGAEAVDVAGAFGAPSASLVSATPSRAQVAAAATANAPALHVAAAAFHARTGH